MSHERPTSLLAVDQAIPDQHIEHLSHGDAADVETLHQLRFGRKHVSRLPLVLGQLAVQDVIQLLIEG